MKKHRIKQRINQILRSPTQATLWVTNATLKLVKKLARECLIHIHTVKIGAALHITAEGSFNRVNRFFKRLESNALVLSGG